MNKSTKRQNAITKLISSLISGPRLFALLSVLLILLLNYFAHPLNEYRNLWPIAAYLQAGFLLVPLSFLVTGTFRLLQKKNLARTAGLYCFSAAKLSCSIPLGLIIYFFFTLQWRGQAEEYIVIAFLIALVIPIAGIGITAHAISMVRPQEASKV